MSLQLYFAFLAACVVLVLVPGPTVTLIVANSLAHGTRAGMVNIAGTQLGLACCIGIVLAGLASLIAAMGWWFDWLRLAGAAYLIWLGWKLLRATGSLESMTNAPKPRGGFFWQGFVVLMSNPKALILFGAFFPQFIDPAGDYCDAGAADGRDRDGGGLRVRHRLRGDGWPRTQPAVDAPGTVHQPRQRRLPDRRRGVAGADAGKVVAAS